VRASVGFAISASATLLLLWGACGPRDHGVDDDGGGSTPTSAQSTTGSFGDGDGAFICGAEVHQSQSKYPLIYFVIDRSGSMSEIDADSGATRLERVQSAAADMVQSLGSLVRVGAAMYPASSISDECATGEQVFAPEVGAGSAFADAIDKGPYGGTPTAATLQAIAPILAGASGPKAVILATDGAPNCNPDASCGPSECMINIAGQCPITNCCQPPEGIPENCVDRARSILAVKALADAGTDVYVIGIPGTDLFAGVLNQMAAVGGVPQQDADTSYYKVDDLDTLAGLFKEIAGSLVSCTFTLSDPPETQGMTNVYFDEVVVPQDPQNGWVWVDGDTIEIIGGACEQLKDGKVKNVQFVSGCPTVLPE
jgi:hypothetical protein